MVRKKRKKGNKPTRTRRAALGRTLQDPRTPRILGLLLILVSVFLLVSFYSYLFTWKEDQSQVFTFQWKLIFSSEPTVSNSLGKLGAMLGHQFFYRWIGVSSFLVPVLVFALGFNMVLLKRVFPVRRLFRYSLFAWIYLPVALSFLLYTREFPYGGAYGMAMNNWLVAFLGNLGAGLLLLFILIVFLMLTVNPGNWKIFRWKRQAEGMEEDEEKELPSNIYERENMEYGREEQAVEVVKTDEPEVTIEETLTPAEGPEPVPADEQVPDLQIEETKEEKKIEGHYSVHTNYDPTLDLPDYKYPMLDLLEDYGQGKINIDKTELERNKDQIINTLQNYNIKISKIKATIGPTVTLYEIVPAPGVRISRIKNLEDDIALSLAALGIRIIAPIPGKGTIGIEVPNAKKEIVPIRTMLASEKFVKADMELPIVLGKNIANENIIADLTKMPHVLMAGATGQGKSVGINAFLMSLLYKKHPSQLKLILIDPKKVELSLYKKLENHFLAVLPGNEESIITNTKQVVHTLKALAIEMDERYDLLKEAHVRNIKEYNDKFIKRKLNPEKGHRYLPYIVMVVDEFADLMMTAGKEIEGPLTRLAQLARAIGIHLVIATQRPSVNIITGTIKANFPARIAFKVTSKVDSRTIIDQSGADQLIGRGDMLLSIGGDITRLQCAFVDTHEVEKVVDFIGSQRGYSDTFLLPEYVEEGESAEGFDISERDEMFEEAARLVVRHQSGSTSLIQRRLKLGYNRAGRIIDQLEAAGIVGPHEGSKAREVLFKDEYELEQFLNSLD